MFLVCEPAAPAAGIDLEPDGVYYDLENITIRDCYAVNNTGHGLQSWYK